MPQKSSVNLNSKDATSFVSTKHPKIINKYQKTNSKMPSLFGGVIIGQNICPTLTHKPKKSSKTVRQLDRIMQKWKLHPNLPVLIQPGDLNDQLSVISKINDNESSS